MTRAEFQDRHRVATTVMLISDGLLFGTAAASIVSFTGLFFVLVFQGTGVGEFSGRDAIIMLVTAIVSCIACALVAVISNKTTARLEQGWNRHYAGSRWKTPAGEVGEFVSSDVLGKTITIRFHASDTDSMSVDDLVSMEGRNLNTASSWSSSCAAWITALLMVTVAITAIYVSELPDVFAGPAVVILISSLLGGVATILCLGGPYRQEKSRRLHELSVCDWKTLDGRIGKVRSVRPGDSDGLDDYLNLVFQDGSKKSFKKGDLIPVVVERDPVEVAQAA